MQEIQGTPQGHHHLVRGLGLIAAVSIIIGNVIGTGVFLKARVMTCNLGTPGWVIAAWIAAGILSLAEALTYAELSAMMFNSPPPGPRLALDAALSKHGVVPVEIKRTLGGDEKNVVKATHMFYWQLSREDRRRLDEAQELHPLVAHLDIDRNMRQQGDAIAIRDHLHHGRETGRTKPGIAAAGGAKRQGLIAQAMPLLQKDQLLLVDRVRAHAQSLGARIARRAQITARIAFARPHRPSFFFHPVAPDE